MTKIKNIIFDFGGVLLDLDQTETYRAFSTLFGQEITPENVTQIFGPIFHQIETGEISDETFLWKIQHLKSGNLDPLKIIQSFNAMLIDFRPKLLPFLESLKKDYQTALLSNTNSIHIRYVMHSILEKRYGVRTWKDYFHHVFYSHEMGMRKPNLNIFHQVTDSLKLNPSETLFIDDTEENVQAAIQCGWKAVLHDPHEKIENKLAEYIFTSENNESSSTK